MDYEQWKKEVEAEAENVACAGDLFDAIDPYDLQAEAKAWFDTGGTPKAFVHEVFAEDIARQTHDEQMAEECAREEFGGEDDVPWWERRATDEPNR